MTEEKIFVIKSPIVPTSKIDDEIIAYDNQVTYSVRLANGMIVTRPEEFPNDLTERIDLDDVDEDTA